MTPVCPFVKAARHPDAQSARKHGPDHEAKGRKDSGDSATISPKCPFGYDSQSFKIGPLSCMICQALLFECSKCVPCSHLYCKFVLFILFIIFPLKIHSFVTLFFFILIALTVFFIFFLSFGE